MKTTMYALLGILLTASVAMGAATKCQNHFYGGEAPDMITSLNAKAREVCYGEFALKHSGVTRTPIYVSEYLSPIRLQAAADMVRDNSFHPDPNIPIAERSELNDYKSSGYDRGHMAPNADFSNEKSQFECFSLANMVPQDPNNNRGIWKKLEEAVRKYVKTNDGMLFVVSGPIYDKNPKLLKGRVTVPTKLFKAVYNVKTKEAGVYLVDNKPGTGYRKISLSELKTMSGLDVFPTLPLATKGKVAGLPTP